MDIFSIGNLNLFYLLISIVLGLLNIYQFFGKKKDDQAINSLVRSWHNHVQGLKNALHAIASQKVDSQDKNVLYGNLQAIAQQAVALEKAMGEERLHSESEIGKKKHGSEKQIKDTSGRSSK